MIMILRAVDEARFFPELRPAVSEKHLKEKTQVQVQGYVSKKSGKDERLTLELQDIVFNETLVSDEKILAYLEKDTLSRIPEMGEQITVAGKINFYQEPRNPGNFNQKFYYQKQNIYAFIGSASIVDSDRQPDGKKNRLGEALWRVKKKAAEVIEAFMGEEHGGMLCAMLLGEKGLLEDDIRDTMGKSGVGHLYAVSGIHVSFFGYGIYRLLRKTGLPIWSCAVAGSIFLLLYVQLSGASVSARRACIMFLVRMGAEAVGRVYDGLTALAAAAILILLRQPLELWDAGFLLSFGAILGIYGVLPVMRRCMEDLEIGRIAAGTLAALAVNLVILPVMLWFYFEYALYSIIWNVAVVSLAPVVLGAGLCGTLLGGASLYLGVLRIGAVPAFWVTGKILWFYEAGSRFWLKLPGSRMVAGQPAVGQILIYYGLLFIFLLAAGRKKRMAVIMTAGLGLGILFLPHGKRGEAEVVMLDVGQGDSFFIRGPQKGTYLIDGGSSTVGKVGKYRIEPFLKSRGVGTLDYVFLSHGDADHMNGIAEMLENQRLGIRIRNLILPPEEVQDDSLKELAQTAIKNNTRVAVMKKGGTITEGEFEISCKAPDSQYTGEPGNAASMVLEVSWKEFDMLFTGDVEDEGEEILEESKELKQYDVLKVAHHGSKNSSSENFLRQTMPGIAWISAGVNNQYGHPHEETTEKLRQTGAKIYGTQENGAVTLVTDGETLKIGTHL